MRNPNPTAQPELFVAEWIHFTLLGIILPTLKLKVYTFLGLMNAASRNWSILAYKIALLTEQGASTRHFPNFSSGCTSPDTNYETSGAESKLVKNSCGFALRAMAPVDSRAMSQALGFKNPRKPQNLKASALRSKHY